jgi:chromosome segregation ATPase
MSPTPSRWLATLPLLLLCGCHATESRKQSTGEPPDHLARASTDAEIYWGPKQNLLFTEYKTLQDIHVQLGKRADQLAAENQDLKAQLDRDGSNLQKERSLRAQAEAETETQRQRTRELEARIVELSIEKAKLEQQILLAKIDALRQLLDEPPAAAEAAPVPPRGR